jgi:hypothetical protein
LNTTVAEMLTNAVTSELWINLGFSNGDFEPNLNVALSDYITAHVRDKIVAESTIDPYDLIGVFKHAWSHMEVEKSLANVSKVT